MELISQLQDLCLSNCNEDWGHEYGVTIDTLDNLGWSVKIVLTGTKLLGYNFQEVNYGVGKESEPGSNNWLRCWVGEASFLVLAALKKWGNSAGVFKVGRK